MKKRWLIVTSVMNKLTYLCLSHIHFKTLNICEALQSNTNLTDLSSLFTIRKIDLRRNGDESSFPKCATK